MVSLTTFARTASARMSERVTAAVWGQTRRFFRMQSRLRSNEPTQIFVCAVTGSAVGALVAGLHWLVDFLHQVGFAVSGDHSLSTGIGVDPMRIMIVPAVGGRTRSSTRSRPMRCMAGACRWSTAYACWSPP
jgi:CIC family chloride channel protein